MCVYHFKVGWIFSSQVRRSVWHTIWGQSFNYGLSCSSHPCSTLFIKDLKCQFLQHVLSLGIKASFKLSEYWCRPVGFVNEEKKRVKKKEGCICLFFAETVRWGRLKMSCRDKSVKKKAKGTIWQDLTKPIRGEGVHQTERKPADDGEEMQTRHLGLRLSARMPVCLGTRLSVGLSAFHSFHFWQWHLSRTILAVLL